MTNARSFILKALLPLGAMLAFAACIDPVVIGGNGSGGTGGSGAGGPACTANTDCGAGQTCVNGVCSGGGMMTCNGMPSPLSCTQTGCAAGQTCVPDPDPSHCYPSNCQCDPSTGMWACTADCGQGSHCIVPQPCGANGGCPSGQMCDASGMCVGACVPSAETCNGIDDNCNGAIDEATPGTTLCPNGGQCVMGQCGGNVPCTADADCGPNQVCQNGFCSGGPTCTPEVCNGLDDDCNGVVDDGSGAVCADGTLCVMGQCGVVSPPCGPMNPCPAGQVCTPNGVCSPGVCVPTAEVCNGIDDNCNGTVDEVTPGTILCANGGQCVNGQCATVVQCGPNNPCPMGQVCSAMGVCTSGCVATPEVCNGIDDNCNGVIDDAAAGTTLCSNGAQCVNGTCGGVVQCGPNTPCPMGQFCNAGVCTMQCASNANCPSGQLCINGLCK